MTNIGELCAPHIKAAQECTKETYKKLVPKLQESGFFKLLPNIQNIDELSDIMENSSSLQANLMSAANMAGVDLDDNECDTPAINYNGEIVLPTTQTIDENGDPHYIWINEGKLIHCDYNGNIDTNMMIEALNQNGFNLELLEITHLSSEYDL